VNGEEHVERARTCSNVRSASGFPWHRGVSRPEHTGMRAIRTRGQRNTAPALALKSAAGRQRSDLPRTASRICMVPVHARVLKGRGSARRYPSCPGSGIPDQARCVICSRPSHGRAEQQSTLPYVVPLTTLANPLSSSTFSAGQHALLVDVRVVGVQAGRASRIDKVSRPGARQVFAGRP